MNPSRPVRPQPAAVFRSVSADFQAGFLWVDHAVAELYRSGIAQSTVVHTAILLAMALVVVAPESVPKPVSLVCNFNAPAHADVAADISIEQQELPLAELVPADDAAEMLAQAAAVPQELLNDPESIAVGDVELASFEADAAAEPDIAELVREVPGAIREVSLPQRPQPTGRQRAGMLPVATGRGFGGGGNGGDGFGGDGFGGEMGRRLSAAGAQTGDVQISIAWNGVDDIDVHVMVEPLNGGPPSVICWMNRMGFCGGFLDVDANANPGRLMQTPVENIFWAKGQAPYGRYTVAVHHFRNWSGRSGTPVEVAVLVDGQVSRFQPVAIYGQPLPEGDPVRENAAPAVTAVRCPVREAAA